MEKGIWTDARGLYVVFLHRPGKGADPRGNRGEGEGPSQEPLRCKAID